MKPLGPLTSVISLTLCGFLCIPAAAVFPSSDAHAAKAQRAQGCVVVERGPSNAFFRNHCGALVHVEYNVEGGGVCAKKSRDYYPCAANITPSGRHLIGPTGKRVEWAACMQGYVQQRKPWESAYECR